MAEKYLEGIRTTIKHRGYFDLQGLLKAIQGFFGQDDYTPEWEQLKVRSDEYEIIFRGDKKENEWIKFEINIHIWIYDYGKVEIVKEGKKVMMDKGKFICEVEPTLIVDWQNRFEGKPPFTKFVGILKDLYLKYIMKKDIGDYWEDVLLMKTDQLCKLIQRKLGQEVV